MPDGSNGWPAWGKYVLKELERLNEQMEAINKKVDRLAIEIAMLKVKSGVWGLVGGLIPVAIGVALLVFRGLK